MVAVVVAGDGSFVGTVEVVATGGGSASVVVAGAGTGPREGFPVDLAALTVK